MWRPALARASNLVSGPIRGSARAHGWNIDVAPPPHLTSQVRPRAGKRGETEKGRKARCWVLRARVQTPLGPDLASMKRDWPDEPLDLVEPPRLALTSIGRGRRQKKMGSPVP